MDADFQGNKPPRLYVESYYMRNSLVNLDVYLKCFEGSIDNEYGDDHEMTIQWTNGGPGTSDTRTTGWSNFTDPMETSTHAMDQSLVWQPMTWPNLVGDWTEQETGNSTTDGTNSVSYSDTYEGIGPFPSPNGIPFEHGLVQGKSDVDLGLVAANCMEVGGGSGSYFHSGNTVIKLQTGGKAGVNRQNLFVFTATAQQGQWVFASRLPLIGAVGPVSPIVPTNITIQGKALGPDGVLYIALPDNADLDVTPLVTTVNYYTYNLPPPQKYILSITANGIDLSTNTPEFCVGQYLTFAPNWNPGVPPYVSSVSKWTLPGKYVNTSWQSQCWVPGPSGTGFYEPCGSINYAIDADLLTNQITSCWYVNKPGGSVTYGINMEFSNGQQVDLLRQGSFTIFRPRAIMVNANFHGTPTVVWETPWYTTLGVEEGAIQLGHTGGPNNMSYTVQVISSDFPGAAKITQICNIDTSGLGDCTGCLDGGDPYSLAAQNNSIVAAANPLPHANILWLDDSPDANTTTGYVYMNDSFTDYIMFNPQPGGPGTYVTLGTVTWGVNADSTYPNTNIAQSVTGPTGPDNSDSFPQWTTVRSGN